MTVFSHDGRSRIRLRNHAVYARRLDSDLRADGKPILGGWFELGLSDGHVHIQLRRRI
jgi:hypothetical protein